MYQQFRKVNDTDNYEMFKNKKIEMPTYVIWTWWDCLTALIFVIKLSWRGALIWKEINSLGLLL